MCWWWGSFAPGANFISMVARLFSRSTTSVLPATPGNEVFSHGSAATSTKRDAIAGSFSCPLAFGVSPLMPAVVTSCLQVFPDPDDLHCIRAARLADRLADG